MTSTLLPGAPFLAYRESQLFIEDMCLQDLANTHGTPLFVYSKAAMLHALAAYQRAFAGRDAKVHYAMKANSSLGVLQVFAHAGCGFDIVSAGELERVLAAGGHAADVIFSGVGKTREEMRVALQAGIACFNVESEAELDVLNQVAVSVGKVAPVSIRVNPNVDPKTHPYISTGLKGNKFGIAHERTLQAYQHAAQLPGLKVVGIDCHIGSQITTSEPYMDALDKVLDLVEQSEVQYLKPGEQKNFCIIDAAMNDLPRPAMYEAFHQIVPLTLTDAATQVYDVVGPVCESGDWIGRDRALNVQSGDTLAVLSAGAYCMSMASNYNTRGRAAEVLVDGNKAHVIRMRESMADQLRCEVLPFTHTRQDSNTPNTKA